MFKPTERHFTVRRCGREEWRNFSRYHYLTGELNNSAKCYGLYTGNLLQIGFCAVIYFPRNNGTAMKRIHRLVITPDWQGIGIGKQFVTAVAEIERKTNDVFLVTSNPAMKHALKGCGDWHCQRNSFSHDHGKEIKSSRQVKTATFVMRRKVR